VAVATAICGTVSAQEAGFSANVASIEEVPAMQSLKTNKLPTSGENACYARVSVPAVYKTEFVEAEIRPKLSRFKITPPVFKEDSQQVVLYPAVTSIKAVQPVIEDREEKLEIMAGSSEWVRNSLKSKQPLTQGEMQDIKATGVDLAKVKSGTCLYEHYQAATIDKIPQKVLVSEATEKLEVVDAKLKDDVASVTLKPQHLRVIEVPPTFQKGEEKVLTENATKKWQTKCGAVQRVDHMTGETLCLVDVAAKYETIATESIDVPALITQVDEKAKVKTFKVKTLVSDTSEKRTAIAAKYDNIDLLKVSKPASYSWLPKASKLKADGKTTGRVACFVERPAKFATYKREVVKTAGRFERRTLAAKTKEINARIEWQPVLCEVNMSKDIIASLQKALSKRGYAPGPIDGVVGRGTLNAIRKYQADNKMADGGLTIETLKKLGVKM